MGQGPTYFTHNTSKKTEFCNLLTQSTETFFHLLFSCMPLKLQLNVPMINLIYNTVYKECLHTISNKVYKKEIFRVLKLPSDSFSTLPCCLSSALYRNIGNIVVSETCIHMLKPSFSKLQSHCKKLTCEQS